MMLFFSYNKQQNSQPQIKAGNNTLHLVSKIILQQLQNLPYETFLQLFFSTIFTVDFAVYLNMKRCR